MNLKLSQVKSLRRQNTRHHNNINDKLSKATSVQKRGIQSARKAYYTKLSIIPFFEKLLKKQIPFEVQYLSGKKEKFKMLGVGFGENGGFRRSVILIDEKGRANLFGRISFGEGKEENAVWWPYSIVGKMNGRFVLNSADLSERERREELMPINDAIKSRLGEVVFEKIHPLKANQVKRFM